MFSSREQLINWVQAKGRSIGNVIVIKRSKNNSAINFQCDRGGIYVRKKPNTRNTGSKKINCPFELEGKYFPGDDCWTLRVICERHTHPPALFLEAHPYASRLSEKEVQLVKDLSENGVKPRHILTTIKKQNPENVSTLKTIYNKRQQFRMEEKDGKTQMQVVLSFLEENGYVYHILADSSTNELQNIFFAHPISLEI